LQYVFPKELLAHFEIEKAQVKLHKPTQEKYLEVEFTEVNRRRWRHKQTKEQITRDFSFLAQGSKFTAELAAFLKEKG
jgi:hypothetical protein